ncbi:aspartate/glutamate racemase family protein [Pseudomonas sp. 21LCFQ010]|uniref:amino acid racemase n=1 Tax=Pseudomonas sp. 21LCFQ010 TaxID=2957506 RepID=UPI002097089C|nr:amino acid racemase [Pseudomonas sp. 21LCFQ010]MCO8165902.1 aspartate/glutamate racemase family protein [Pseudomonas sp. 21LCFQ010]
MTSLNLAAGKGRTLGIIGGLGALAGGDLFFKLLKSQPLLADQGRYHLLFEQRPFKDLKRTLDAGASMTSRKLYVFQACQRFAEQGADAVLVPCFASHTFLDELTAELEVPVINMFDALRQYLARQFSPGSHLGILASDYVRAAGIFERFLGEQYVLVYPSVQSQAALMEAVYGRNGIKAGQLDGSAQELLYQAGLELVGQGAQLLLPGMTELSLLSEALQQRGLQLLDINRLYADFAACSEPVSVQAPFKLGVVGGVGPAATVDFIGKVVRHTPAGKDQEHIKLVVEQNPQIPDRTANLLHQDTDPTVAMYATCKRLQEEGAQAIAIPCNTAHAYVQRIQEHLQVPIINMLEETVGHIGRTCGLDAKVGLLATSGTVQSRVYHDAAERLGLALMLPDPAHQALVMNAIYGPAGVKAGYTLGVCREQLLQAAAHLVQQGARVLILGCTELPLILPQADDFMIDGVSVALVDPTTVLAQRCVALAADHQQPGTPLAQLRTMRLGHGA